MYPDIPGKYGNKKNNFKKENIFVSILKATEEKSRIQSQIWSRIQIRTVIQNNESADSDPNQNGSRYGTDPDKYRKLKDSDQ